MYLVINLDGQIVGRFTNERRAYNFADRCRRFCYVEFIEG